MIAQDNPLSPQRITRLKKEFARLSRMTTFQRANERAAAAKADKWLSYKPLTKEQLLDTLEPNDYATLLTDHNGFVSSIGRSTRAVHYDDMVYVWQHVRVVRRPTEMMAIAHGLGFMSLDSDFVVIRRTPVSEERWCIYCQKHHHHTAFIQSKRYLNELSYACRHSKQERKSLVWRLAS